MAKFSERGRNVLRVIQPSTRSTLGEYDSRPPLARYVWYLTYGTFALLAVLRPRTPTFNFRSFYPFLPLRSLTWGNVPGPPRFTVLQATKSWAWDWERGYGHPASSATCTATSSMATTRTYLIAEGMGATTYGNKRRRECFHMWEARNGNNATGSNLVSQPKA